MPSKRILGVDLHGTLLDENWGIDASLTEEITGLFLELGSNFRIFICSGNDLGFVKDRVPGKIINCLEGLVLETGCVFSDKTTEKVLTEENYANKVKGLEKKLKEMNLGKVKYFARRLSSVSIFTKNGISGEPPEKVFERVLDFLTSDKKNDFYVTHSDVAVDIVPCGHNKLTGLKKIDSGSDVFAVADSFNDLSLLGGADYSFAPYNVSKKAISALRGKKEVAELDKRKPLEKNKLYVSRESYGRGTAEILGYIQNHFRNS
ncbi:HAD hydrolase family protein [candidate division WOR-3 bacterium]|nr:HAD hydrolase family protein [candidate division WOR-3 bacterium]